MRDTDRSKLVALYEERWIRLGATPQTLGWTKGKQDVRFDVLLDGLEVEGATFLDVGCGFGDLNVAIRNRTCNYTYLGVDLLPQFVFEARKRYGNPTTQFAQAEFTKFGPAENFDYVIGCGLFAHLHSESDNYDYVAETLSRMHDISVRAVAVDFLSSHVNFRRPGTFYADPARVLEISMELSRNVLLKHNYMPFEFSVIIKKDDAYSDADTLFREFESRRPK